MLQPHRLTRLVPLLQLKYWKTNALAGHVGDRPVLGKEEGTVLRSQEDARALGRFIYQARPVSLPACLCAALFGLSSARFAAVWVLALKRRTPGP